MMLLKQRVSGYWEQTAPKVKRNREATGESERVSTLLSRHMKLSLLLVCVCGGEMMQGRCRAVGTEDPSKTQ